MSISLLKLRRVQILKESAKQPQKTTLNYPSSQKSESPKPPYFVKNSYNNKITNYISSCLDLSGGKLLVIILVHQLDQEGFDPPLVGGTHNLLNEKVMLYQFKPPWMDKC